jgi:hypothetical protein
MDVPIEYHQLNGSAPHEAYPHALAAPSANFADANAQALGAILQTENLGSTILGIIVQLVLTHGKYSPCKAGVWGKAAVSAAYPK